VAIEFIDSKQFKNMFIASANYLESKKDYCNELNVFPVPDGDTGTNMSLTVIAAIKEIDKVDSNNMAEVAKAISSGTLRGARGNSGVIVSQLFRGFAKEVGQYDKVDTVVYANALSKGVDTAYKAVMKPKEGTILTVAKEAANKAAEICFETTDMLAFLEEVINHAEITLQKTPDMLPVLKEAGVVDAGGQGYLYILRGAYMALKNGGDIEFTPNNAAEYEVDKSALTFKGSEDIKFSYCTEFIINTNGLESEREANGIKRYLETIGDSIVAVADDDIIKIHVHTNEPDKAFNCLL
jgi:DAK2 domain fusion protein YloV